MPRTIRSNTLPTAPPRIERERHTGQRSGLRAFQSITATSERRKRRQTDQHERARRFGRRIDKDAERHARDSPAWMMSKKPGNHRVQVSKTVTCFDVSTFAGAIGESGRANASVSVPTSRVIHPASRSRRAAQAAQTVGKIGIAADIGGVLPAALALDAVGALAP